MSTVTECVRWSICGSLNPRGTLPLVTSVECGINETFFFFTSIPGNGLETTCVSCTYTKLCKITKEILAWPEALAKRTRTSTQVNATLKTRNFLTDLGWLEMKACALCVLWTLTARTFHKCGMWHRPCVASWKLEWTCESVWWEVY